MSVAGVTDPLTSGIPFNFQLSEGPEMLIAVKPGPLRCSKERRFA